MKRLLYCALFLFTSCDNPLFNEGATAYLMRKHENKLRTNNPVYDVPTGELTDYLNYDVSTLHQAVLNVFSKLGYSIGKEKVGGFMSTIEGRTNKDKPVSLEIYQEKKSLSRITIRVGGMDMGTTAEQLLEAIKNELPASS